MILLLSCLTNFMDNMFGMLLQIQPQVISLKTLTLLAINCLFCEQEEGYQIVLLYHCSYFVQVFQTILYFAFLHFKMQTNLYCQPQIFVKVFYQKEEHLFFKSLVVFVKRQMDYFMLKLHFLNFLGLRDLYQKPFHRVIP